MRLREIDILKGVAMLLVMLGHSFLQVPFCSLDVAPWSKWLNDAIYSFHMPLFFVVSGFLYNKTGEEKPMAALLGGKAVRLFVPYICVTVVVMAAKLIAPSGMTEHLLSHGVMNNIKFLFVDCGNRWFVYILFLTFVVAILMRRILRNVLARWLLVAALLVFVSIEATGLNVIDLTMRFLPFFVIGMWLRERYGMYCRLMSSGWYMFVSVVAFMALNVVLVPQVNVIPCFKYIFMPITGVNMTWLVCYRLRNAGNTALMRYLLYIGKYSLQFYLLLFPVAVIGYLLGVVLQMTNVPLITLFMFVGQVVSISALVEITRRIPILKYPLGY